eukprot:gene8836-10450_t
MSSNGGTVNFVVGGVYYSLLLSDILANKDCYFASAIKDEWNNSSLPIVIDRDGVLFHHIVGFIYNRRYDLPFAIKGSLSLLVGIRREADYYILPELVKLCDRSYEREMTKWCKEQSLQDLCNAYTMHDVCCELDAIIASEGYAGCLSGTLDSSRVARINVTQALAKARIFVDEEKQKEFYRLSINDEYDCMESLEYSLPTFPGVSSCFAKCGLFAVKEGGYQYASILGAEKVKRIGTVLYIMHSDYTGGVITVTRNGVSQSISKPGEFIMYTSDYTRTISTVTSGALVMAKLDLVSEVELGYREFGMCPSFVPYKTLPVSTCEKLIHAVHVELSLTDTGVVLCLSTLYPIVEFDPSGPYLETDPDILKDRDAVLYAYLKDAFDISLATVYVQRYAHDAKGCVIGPEPTTSTMKKIKIIAPFHGFREPFEVCSGDGDTRKKEFATLYTALYICAK